MGVRDGLGRTGQGVGRGVARVRTRLRANGAGASGLAALTELTLVNAAADALVTVTLAGSQFFSLPTGEARTRIALYLLVTFAPFTLLAPVIGPVLDKFANGRRLAMAVACLARAALVWMLAGALNDLRLYPLALGLLVLSKAFGVVRSAVVPRVLPDEMTLVAVNSRLSLITIVTGAVLAPLGLGIAHLIGYPWVLRLCAAVLLYGVVLAFKLPALVDSADGERTQRDFTQQAARAGQGRLRRSVGSLPAALRGAASLRALVGFLTLYLAFLLRENGGTNVWLGLLAASAGVGSGLGVFIGGRLSRRRPEWLIITALIGATGACAVTAVDYTRATSLLAALIATMAGSMGKLALDAIIQRDIPDDVRTSSFARSETAMQLAWVLGGAIGLIKMPGVVGFSIAATGMLAAIVMEVTGFRRARRNRRSRFAAAPTPGDTAVLARDGQTLPDTRRLDGY